MAKLTTRAALRIINAALKAERTAETPVAVAVCDAGGHILAIVREEGAPPLLAHLAHSKAFTCMAFGKTSGMLEAMGAGLAGMSAVSQATMGAPLAGTKGGLFIKDGRGQTIGAVGVAGGAGDEDVTLAQAGIAAANFTAEG